MEITGPGGVTGPRKIQSKKVETAAPAEQVAGSQGADKAEFSEASRFLQGLESVANVRLDRIRELRNQIEKGDYETPKKLSAAIDKLLEEITG